MLANYLFNQSKENFLFSNKNHELLSETFQSSFVLRQPTCDGTEVRSLIQKQILAPQQLRKLIFISKISSSRCFVCRCLDEHARVETAKDFCDILQLVI